MEIKKMNKLKSTWGAIVLALVGLLATGAGTSVFAVNTYDALVTSAEADITGLSAPVTTLWTAAIGIALIVGVALMIYGMVRKKH
jgi:hypothetical protein